MGAVAEVVELVVEVEVAVVEEAAAEGDTKDATNPKDGRVEEEVQATE